MRARSASSLRRQIAEGARSSRRQRRYSAGFSTTPKTDAAMQRAATLFEPLEMQLRRYSIGSLAESLGGGFLSSMSKNLDSLLSSSLSMSLDEPADSRSSGGARRQSRQRGKAQRLNYQGVHEEELDASNVGRTGDQRYILSSTAACQRHHMMGLHVHGQNQEPRQTSFWVSTGCCYTDCCWQQPDSATLGCL